MTEQKGMVMIMKLVKSLLTSNPCYKAGKKITVKGLMLHSVGCPQPRASVFINSWNRADYDNACVHAFIDGNDGTVYQTLPWNHRGWHVRATIPISAWKCANRLVSNIPAVQYLPVPTRRLQGRLQRGLMKRRWNCLPCFVRSMT